MKPEPTDSRESYLAPDWPGLPEKQQPENVQAYTTLISGGVSKGHYAEFNLATHVGDDINAVRSNRAKLVNDLNLPAEPVWLEQVHSNKVVIADTVLSGCPQADASVSRQKETVCVVLTADCLPVFFCDRAGSEVAIAHAGWRGLHAGIISNTIAAMRAPVEELIVSFGPAIGPQSFEVGEEVREAFIENSQNNQIAFAPGREGRYLCDIYQLAGIELQQLGLQQSQISSSDLCTYREQARFYSYRRHEKTGRMASLIWLT
jgi:polyphenol oxidase